jgi:hypothetical protein
MEQFIVGEVSKNWVNGEPLNGDPILLHQLFAVMIETNWRRGYKLHSFQINRVLFRGTGPDDNELNETIIAVFERVIKPVKRVH